MLGGMLISRISGGAIWWNAIFRPTGQGYSHGFGYANVRKSYSLIVFFPDLGHRMGLGIQMLGNPIV